MQYETQAKYLIIRHRKENIKKCSLRGCENDPRFKFFRYPEENIDLTPELCSTAFALDIEGEPLTKEMINEGQQRPFIIVDGTWRYAQTMIKQLPQLKRARQCTLPGEWVTAYPRKQTGCSDPERGLASIEAIFIASLLAGWSVDGLLDNYYWKDLFFEKNKNLINKFII